MVFLIIAHGDVPVNVTCTDLKPLIQTDLASLLHRTQCIKSAFALSCAQSAGDGHDNCCVAGGYIITCV